MQLELLTADTITWLPYSGEHLTVGFEDGYPTGVEYFISTRRVPLFTDGGWELYLGERAIRSTTGEIRIPILPPARRHWPVSQSPASEIPLLGVDGFDLSEGPCTQEIFQRWWLPRTIGAQSRATQFMGDMVPGSLMMTDWVACVRAPTHMTQIDSLTQQLDRAHVFIRHLGRDPAEAETFVPSSSGAGPSDDPFGFAGADPPLYRPDIPVDRDPVTQEELHQVDRIGDVDIDTIVFF